MLQLPRSKKYKKYQKGKAFNKTNNIITFNKLNFNFIKLITLAHGRLTAKQLQAIQMSINKIMKKLGKTYFKIFPHTPITKKPLEIRMGKGKGNIDHWVYNSKIGITICEIQTPHVLQGIKALKSAQNRLPIKTKILYY